MTAKDVDPSAVARSPIIPRQRPCLGCRGFFASAGPHERICPRCKESEAWLAGQSEFPCYAEGAGGAPSRPEAE